MNAQIDGRTEHLEALHAWIRALALELTNRALAAAVQQLAQQNADLHDGLQALKRALRQTPTPSLATSTHVEQLMDTRPLNTPRTFSEAHTDWKTSPFDFEASVHALRSRHGDLIQQALTAGAVITVSDELDVTLNRPLHYILVSLIFDATRAEIAKAF